MTSAHASAHDVVYDVTNCSVTTNTKGLYFVVGNERKFLRCSGDAEINTLLLIEAREG